jgi:hypothetical protein
MNDSSAERSAMLAKIDLKEVQCLLNIIAQSSLHRAECISAAYSEQAHHFQETLQFLQDINWIRKEQAEVTLTGKGVAAASAGRDKTSLGKQLAEDIAGQASPYGTLIVQYLNQFATVDGYLIHRPHLLKRLQESPVRNVLMDAGAVVYRAEDDSYVLDGIGVDLHIWARNVQGELFAERAAEATKEKQELGAAAEMAVLEYETRRVGTLWAGSVEHVSAKQPYACYDILSTTVNGSLIDRRYIEVKAVPLETYRFLWTAAEVEVAHLLRRRYFLYLLPVVGRNEFDLNRLLIVSDPWVAVYQDHTSWRVEESVISCSRR